MEQERSAVSTTPSCNPKHPGMTQYPDEKSNNPYQQWVQPPAEQSQYPAQADWHSAPGAPPAYGEVYVSRDGAPPPGQGYTQIPPQQGYHPSQEYYPPLGPPQGYQAPPEGSYDQKGPSGVSPYQQGSLPEAPYEQGRSGPSGYSPYPGSTSQPNYSQSLGASPSPPDKAPSPSGGGGMSLSSFFGDKGTPPMWQRLPPAGPPYNQFPPMCLISNGKELSKGFPELPPPCELNQHPFSTHDINEEDWKRFLADIKKSGSLSAGQRIKSNVIPLAIGASFFGGFLMTHAIEKKMKAKNRTAAGDLIDHWNHFFFGPRRMEVVLCQASERLSGRHGAAPVGDPKQQRMANGLRHRTSSDESSSSDSDSEDERRHSSHSQKGDYKSDRRARRAAKREARADRREERRARKADRRARKARGDYEEPYQLFITPI
ncbi:hypothetical protein PAXRUDRAFT_825344 [Paxillus rubicundulus Ve08.2h10]|uniref:Unplaced genomic scaffold scaffold_134, whole genome shotgun sequence n=1 Tax=Paxillus rubicundulus Ve08.2h10 TaxID=930991 RepID=A0A0D0E6B4_9AGAM|nr:hypothetical protein PAXRUDRAFT_825344 [Paxillus rubicundulus Ve08.2h10]